MFGVDQKVGFLSSYIFTFPRPDYELVQVKITFPSLQYELVQVKMTFPRHDYALVQVKIAYITPIENVYIIISKNKQHNCFPLCNPLHNLSPTIAHTHWRRIDWIHVQQTCRKAHYDWLTSQMLNFKYFFCVSIFFYLSFFFILQCGRK